MKKPIRERSISVKVAPIRAMIGTKHLPWNTGMFTVQIDSYLKEKDIQFFINAVKDIFRTADHAPEMKTLSPMAPFAMPFMPPLNEIYLGMRQQEAQGFAEKLAHLPTGQSIEIASQEGIKVIIQVL